MILCLIMLLQYLQVHIQYGIVQYPCWPEQHDLTNLAMSLIPPIGVRISPARRVQRTIVKTSVPIGGAGDIVADGNKGQSKNGMTGKGEIPRTPTLGVGQIIRRKGGKGKDVVDDVPVVNVVPALIERAVYVAPVSQELLNGRWHEFASITHDALEHTLRRAFDKGYAKGHTSGKCDYLNRAG